MRIPKGLQSAAGCVIGCICLFLPVGPAAAGTISPQQIDGMAPLPAIMDREWLAALSTDFSTQIYAAGQSTPLDITMGSDLVASLHRSGATRLVSIVLRNRGDQDIRDVLVLLRDTGGTIEEVFGSPHTWRPTDHGWIGAVPAIDARSQVRIVVKYLLAEGGEVEAERQNELIAIVRPRNRDTVEATMQWRSADCAARYAQRLQSIRERPDSDARKALKAATSRERDLPRRPLFSVSAKPLSKELRQALRVAETMQRTGGVDGKLVSSEYKWLTGRLSRDLRNYLAQPESPAMCAPSAPMLDYLQRRAAPLGQRIESFRAYQEDWQAHARTTAQSALDELTTLRLATSDPAFPLSTARPKLDTDWHGAILQLAEAGGMNDPALQAMRGAPDDLQMLKIAKTQLAEDPVFAPSIVQKPRRKGSRRMVKVKQPNPRAQALHAAYGAIERAHYLDLGVARQDALDNGLVGILREIRQASEESCVCAY